MLNTFAAVGQIGTEPKRGQSATGIHYAKFALLVQRDKKESDGTAKCDRINCGIYGNAAAAFQYCEKGDLIAIRGKLTTSNYQKDGQWVNNWEINVDSFNLLHKNVPAQPTAPAPQVQAPPPVYQAPQMQTQPAQVDPFATQDPAGLPFDIMY